MKRVHLAGYGDFEFRAWEDLKDRDVRYVCTDWEDDEDEGMDFYEITDPQADDFGTWYATQIH